MHLSSLDYQNRLKGHYGFYVYLLFKVLQGLGVVVGGRTSSIVDIKTEQIGGLLEDGAM